MFGRLLGFLYINHCAVGNPADLFQPCPPFALKVIRSFGFSAQQEIRDQQDGGRDGNQGVEMQ